MKFWHIILLLVLLLLAVQVAAAPSVPAEAEKYRRDLVRTARYVWGLDAPIATFAAQIHQESRWNPDARSSVGASGLAQFMPATATWISGAYKGLGAAAPYNAAWALRAMVTYDQHLMERLVGATECDLWWAVLRSYNGGIGHWKAEAGLAENPLRRTAVDAQCGKARRHVKHCAENLGYPDRIIQRWQPRYLGWGRGVTCL